jgi:hypothetical protein
LAQRFGRARVFRDEFTLKPGEDFPPEIERAIQHASVMLVLIGRRWLTLTDPQGLRRIDQPNDYIRREIEMGLRFGVTIVPSCSTALLCPTPNTFRTRFVWNDTKKRRASTRSRRSHA